MDTNDYITVLQDMLLIKEFQIYVCLKFMDGLLITRFCNDYLTHHVVSH